MSLTQKLWLYGACGLTVGSGGIWAVLWHFAREDAEMAGPWENTLMKVHLAGALVLLVAVGAALPKHASKSWAAKINRPSSVFFAASLIGTVVTGYFILAYSWETQVVHFSHIALGVLMTLLLPLHIIVGKYLEKKRLSARKGSSEHEKFDPKRVGFDRKKT